MPKFSRIMRQVKKRNSKIRLNLRTVLNKNLRRNIRKYISIKRVKKHNKKTRKLVGGTLPKNVPDPCYNATANTCETCDIKPQKNNTIPGKLIKPRTTDINWFELQKQKLNHECKCDEAKKEENKKKNRYPNILPNESTRVILKYRGERYNYINANTINLPNLPTSVTPVNPSYNYIATQCPTKNTVDDFWRMVLEKNVQNIVMINTESELTQNTCYKYFPDDRVSYDNPTIDPHHP